MNSTLLQHIDRALVEFTGKEFFDDLVRAKLEFSRLTGPIDEDDDDYEARMDAFNIWYLFDFVTNGEKSAIERYVELHQLPETESQLLLSVASSIFQYSGTSLRKRIILKDLLHKTKITLSKEHGDPGLLKGDLFVGKVFRVGEESYLLPVYCLLPEESLAPINKQMKLLRKQLADEKSEKEFLLKTMHLKNRHRRFSHVSPKVFFKYD